MAKRELSIADQIDGAVSLEDLKTRLRNVLHQLESHFESKVAIYFVDNQTDNDPNKYKAGDIVVDSSIITGAIVIYAYDTHKNKIAQTLQSFAGVLPLSYNEIFVGNGANTIFNTQVAFVPKSTQVYSAGLRQRIGTQYIENASTHKQITFTAAPANGAVVIIDYEIARTL